MYKHLINIIKVSYLISRFTYILNYQCLNNICCFRHILVRKCSKMTFPKLKHIKYMSCHMCYQRNQGTSVMTTCTIIYVDFGLRGCIIVHKILRTMYMTSEWSLQNFFFFLKFQYCVANSKYFNREEKEQSSNYEFWSAVWQYASVCIMWQMSTVNLPQYVLFCSSQSCP